MATFKSFAEYIRALETTIDDDAMTRVGHKAGRAGKDATLRHAKRKLGPDRALSNFRLDRARAPRINAGYDILSADSVGINTRPKGLAILADSGRRRGGGGVIDTDRFAAVMTPQGPRAWSSWGPSRGTGWLRNAEDQMEKDVPRAAADAVAAEIRKAMG